jgi:virulence-associated protein VagC
MKVKVTEQGLVIPKEFLTGIKAVEVHRENNQIVLTPTTEDDSIWALESEPITLGTPNAAKVQSEVPTPKSLLGQRLRALRAKIVASGEPLLTAEAIEQEIDEQRDRLKEFES